MPVYVDPLIKYVDKGIFKNGSCHLFADTEEELINFACNKLGMRMEHYQTNSMPHFDLTALRRKQAVNLGAIEIDRYKMVEIFKAYKEKK